MPWQQSASAQVPEQVSRKQPQHNQGGLRGQIRHCLIGPFSYTIVIKELCFLTIGAASLTSFNFKVMTLSSA